MCQLLKPVLLFTIYCLLQPQNKSKKIQKLIQTQKQIQKLIEKQIQIQIKKQAEKKDTSFHKQPMQEPVFHTLKEQF